MIRPTFIKNCLIELNENRFEKSNQIFFVKQNAAVLYYIVDLLHFVTKSLLIVPIPEVTLYVDKYLLYEFEIKNISMFTGYCKTCVTNFFTSVCSFEIFN